MNILVAFNDGYTMPTRVMLKSLIENNQEDLDIYVLYVALSDDSIKALSNLNSNTAVLHFIQIDDSKLECAPLMSFYSKEAYIRLFAQLYLPNDLERILWLDGDLIVKGEINEFYNQSFDNELYVAYKDMDLGDSIKKKESLGMPVDVAYINSGVLLMNLREIRNKVSDVVITNYIKENSDKIEFVDQDVFNGLLYNSFKVIDTGYEYNYFARRIRPWNKRMVYRNARIIHYVEKKPWNEGYKDYGFHLWWKYAFMTDIRYREKYKRLLFSYALAKPRRWVWMEMDKWCPKLKQWLFEKIGDKQS